MEPSSKSTLSSQKTPFLQVPEAAKNKVPSEILIHIFQYLSSELDLYHVSCVCKLWHQIVKTQCPLSLAWKPFVRSNPLLKPWTKMDISRDIINHLDRYYISVIKNELAITSLYAPKEIELHSSNGKQQIRLEKKICDDENYSCVFLAIHDRFLTALFNNFLGSCVFQTYSIKDGKIMYNYNLPFEPKADMQNLNNGGVSKLFTVDGNYFAFCNQNSPYVLNLESGECFPLKVDDLIRQVNPNQEIELTFLEMKKGKIAAAFDNGHVQIWDLISGTAKILDARTDIEKCATSRTKIKDIWLAMHCEINKIAIAVSFDLSQKKCRHSNKSHQCNIQIFDLDAGKKVHSFFIETNQPICFLRFESDANSRYKLIVSDKTESNCFMHWESNDKGRVISEDKVPPKLSVIKKISKLFSSKIK